MTEEYPVGWEWVVSAPPSGGDSAEKSFHCLGPFHDEELWLRRHTNGTSIGDPTRRQRGQGLDGHS